MASDPIIGAVPQLRFCEREFQFLENIRAKYALDKIEDDCTVLPKDDATDLLVTADSLGFEIVEVPTIWVDQAGSQMRPMADARRMALSALRLWVHHHALPIDRSPRSSTVIDLRDARIRAQVEEDERVAT